MPVSLAAIARSLDAPDELAPHLAEVFAPLTSLGGRPRQIVSLLRAGGVGEGSRVLELACGKGAGAIAAARALRCRVDASDAFRPFVLEARRAAERAGVEALCRFRTAEAESFESRAGGGRYGAAMMISLWPAARAAKTLRRFVRPGGVYIIDDAVLAAGAPRRFRLAGLRTSDEMRELVESSGDRVARVCLQSAAQSRRHEERLHGRLVRWCERLAREHPALRSTLRRFLAQQRRSIEDLCGPIRPAVWLIRRSEG